VVPVPINRLVLAGEAIVDVLMRVPSLPDRGGDLIAGSSAIDVGGGFNVMAAAARQGLRVEYAGGHGTGPWGSLVRAALDEEGIGVLRPASLAADTGFDVALVEPDGERTFITSLGAETHPGGWETVPVAAGDAAAGLDPVAAASRANAAAALAVTRPGPATAPGRAELDEFVGQGGDRV
jgi:sugar/nucleoside kinase (ribokinase family)